MNLRATCDCLQSENALLRRELAIKDARFERIPPRKRPPYTARERVEVLAIQAARGLNNTRTARRFQVTVQTIRSWAKRLRIGDGLLELPEQFTRYPDYVRYLVQQLHYYFPLLGSRKIADILARTGLHISDATVGRIFNEPPVDPSKIKRVEEPKPPKPDRQIIAKYSDHVWSLDFTKVPKSSPLWRLLPESENAWQVLTTIDHFSRRAPGMAVFE